MQCDSPRVDCLGILGRHRMLCCALKGAFLGDTVAIMLRRGSALLFEKHITNSRFFFHKVFNCSCNWQKKHLIILLQHLFQMQDLTNQKRSHSHIWQELLNAQVTTEDVLVSSHTGERIELINWNLPWSSVLFIIRPWVWLPTVNSFAPELVLQNQRSNEIW